VELSGALAIAIAPFDNFGEALYSGPRLQNDGGFAWAVGSTTRLFNEEGHAMKIVALIGLVAGTMLCGTGCATPGYSAQERNQQIARNWDYEIRQASDDFDHLLMLRPASHLTIWSVE
jgi:hypothetical protein